jgi:hypothetical protein
MKMFCKDDGNQGSAKPEKENGADFLIFAESLYIPLVLV